MKARLIITAAIAAAAALAAPAEIIVTPPLPVTPGAETAASVSNEHLRLRYVRCGQGSQALACVMEAKVDGRWTPFASPMEDNKVFVITGPKHAKRPRYKKFYPAWADAGADTLTTDPFLSGSVCEAVPVNVRADGKNAIAVDYVTAGDHTVTGRWTLEPGARAARLTLTFTPAASGSYSLGVLGLHAALPSAVTKVLMPPMYQYARVPAERQMLLSVMMPQPVAMVETKAADTPLTAFVSGDASMFPRQWGSADYSPMGFALKNHDGLTEPAMFAPVLGMPDSQMKAGVPVERTFVVGLAALPWNETLEYTSRDLYGVRGYRHQPARSLTEAMYAITELMLDDRHSGWDASMRGFYDIEGKPTKAPTVVHSAPLAVVAAAINAGDEEMYLSRALPTIEYTLSRKGYRWSTRATDEGYNKDPETLRLSPEGSQFTTTYYEGLNRLLGGLNPWLADIALPGGEPRAPRGYSAPVLSWVQALGAWRLTGDAKWLRRAKSVATRDAQKHIYANSAKPMRYQAFYNSTMYAPWWDFLDLYEVTGDKQYLDAARTGAAHTLAGIRVWPAVTDSLITLHPGDRYDGNTTMWWKGSEEFRLGFPRVDGDAPEHRVEEWLVSPVGLGFEQPSTYFLRQKGKQTRPVFMSSWAPALTRLAAHTGNDLYDDYASNAVIGRFTNYPGYYATGYTDITMSPDFPYQGPDVSSIYYHHIPPHLAFTTDYLVTEAARRSGGRVSFPYGRQEGFVWFSNRVYGGAPGTVYDDSDARLWLRHGLLESSDPEVNYLTAASPRQVWVLLSNESAADATTTLTPGAELAAAADIASPKVLNAKGGRAKADAVSGGTLTVTIPAKGFLAVALPLKPGAAEASPSLAAILGANTAEPLRQGYITAETGTAAGRIHLFRIRSPYGWDSVYGYCENPPSDGGVTVTAECAGQVIETPSYPHEWSFARFAPADRVSVKVTIAAEGADTQTINLEI